MATIIASQALISGAFSLTRQAIQMRLLPRMHIRPTSGEHRGQIYLSVVNWALMAGSIAVVLGFRSSSSLAAAYGIAVSGTMLVTSILLFSIVRQRWRWPLVAALLLIGIFALIDSLFLVANATKIAQGGWLPLVVGAVLAGIMLIWRRGTLEIQKRVEHMAVPFDQFLESLSETLVMRVPGTAVVLTRSLEHASPVLVQQARHNRVLHEHVVLLTILPTGRPIVPPRERLEISDLGQGFHRVIAKIGFMQNPDLAAIIRGCARMGLKFCEGNIHYMVAYEHVSRRPHKPHFPILLWHVFSVMSKTGVRLTDFLRVPEKQVLEIGIKVEI
jgi:KUP system potassium uptake protein